MFPASEYKAQFPGSMMTRQPCNFGNRFVEFWVYKLTFAGEISTIRTWEITKPGNGKPVTCLSRLWYGCKGAPTALTCRRCSSSYLKIGEDANRGCSFQVGKADSISNRPFPSSAQNFAGSGCVSICLGDSAAAAAAILVGNFTL